MKVAIELPERSDLSQYTVEILAIEGYRTGTFTPEQLHRMLSLNTRREVEAFAFVAPRSVDGEAQ